MDEVIAGQAVAVRATAGLVQRLVQCATAFDRDEAYPVDAVAGQHAAGLCAASLPTRLGGLGLNGAARRLELLGAFKHSGRGDLVVSRRYEGPVNALTLQRVCDFGNAAQQGAAARATAAGLWFGVWHAQGADGAILAAQPGGAGWRLHGSKLNASKSGHVDRPPVTAQHADGGWQMVITEAGSAAIHIDRSFWPPLGMRASAIVQLRFYALPVRQAALAGAAGDDDRETAFSAGAVRFGAVPLGGTAAVLDETHRFLRSVGRADDPYQRIRVGEMAMWVESGNLRIDRAARHGADCPCAHGMRNAIEQTGLRVPQRAARRVGARGLRRRLLLERVHRDLTHCLRQSAPDTVPAAAGTHVLATGAHVLASAAPSHQL